MKNDNECVGKVLYELKNRKVINCQVCQYSHLYPIPTQEELENFYKNLFSESTPSPNYEDKYWTIEELVLKKRNRRVLDIGSWDGQQLQYFLNAGWECVGIEPNAEKNAITQKRGVKTIQNLFQNIKDDELGKYDAVNLSFVLEHVADPRIFLKRISDRVIEKNGVICVEVPNDYNLFQEAAKRSYNMKDYWVVEPDHINYFNYDSIKKLVERCGFNVSTVEASFPMELFLLFGENYVENPDLGKTCHHKRLLFEDALRLIGKNNLKRDLYRKIAELGLGRSLTIFAIKSK